MRIPSFLKVEAAGMLLGLSVNPVALHKKSSWPIPTHWTEDQVEQFFKMFNMHHTRIDAEATKRGHALVSRAVNYRNVGLFLASLLLQEASYEHQLEEVQKSLTSALGPDSITDLDIKEILDADPTLKRTAFRITFKANPKPGDDLGSGQ